MNIKRWLMAGFAAFAAIFVLDLIVHGTLLTGLYDDTAFIWRAKPEAHQKMWLMTLSQLLLGLALAWFYTKGFEARKAGLAQGLRFGWYAGLTLAAAQGFVWYVVLPIPFVLNLGWVVSIFVDALAAGALIGIVYKSK